MKVTTKSYTIPIWDQGKNSIRHRDVTYRPNQPTNQPIDQRTTINVASNPIARQVYLSAAPPHMGHYLQIGARLSGNGTNQRGSLPRVATRGGGRRMRGPCACRGGGNHLFSQMD